MSQPGKEVPVVRPRRRINPPAHLVDYELGDPLQQRQPVPARSQSRVQSPSTAGHTKSSSPVSQDFELDKWILRDEWPSASDWRGEKVEELTAMLQEMKRENADLRCQASQLPDIISALREMRQQNAMLHNELQSLKAEKGALSRPGSPGPFTPVVNRETSQLFRPTPAPRTMPPTAVRELRPATMHEASGIAEDFRNMDISSSMPERVPLPAHYSDPPQPRHPRSPQRIPSHQAEFRTPAHERMPSAHTDDRHQHQQPRSIQEKTYRGPAPTIPFLTAPDTREFSRLRIALENILPEDATEQFKYQILTDHLKLEEALLVADSYSNSRFPFTNTMKALNKMYGQPHHLALQRIAELMDGPNIRSGEVKAFRMFGLQVRSLVSMLEQLGQKGSVELECGSHVSRSMSKLPHDLRSSFKRYTHPLHVAIPTLLDFADWLEYELQVQDEHTDYTSQPKVSSLQGRETRRDSKQPRKPTTILLGTEKPKPSPATPADSPKPPAAKREWVEAYCPYCDNNRHFLNGCENFKLLSKEQKVTWIKGQNRCWRCGRGHHAANVVAKRAKDGFLQCSQ